MRQVHPLHQTAVSVGLLDRIQIGALDVLDKGELESLVLISVFDADGHLLHLQVTARLPPALAGDDLVFPIRHRTHDDRLKQTVLLDGCGELLDLLLLEIRTRLIGIRFDIGDGDLIRRLLGDLRLRILPFGRSRSSHRLGGRRLFNDNLGLLIHDRGFRRRLRGLVRRHLGIHHLLKIGGFDHHTLGRRKRLFNRFLSNLLFLNGLFLLRFVVISTEKRVQPSTQTAARRFNHV